MNPAGSTSGSTAGVDERLARLAPTTSPDPERLAAARAALDATLDGPGDPRSRRVGDAHVLELRDHRREDGGDDVPDATGLAVVTPVGAYDDDVVVPLGRGRTARERRRRRVQLGAAAAGVVGVVAVGLALTGRPPAPVPAGPPPSACASRLTTAAHQADDVEQPQAWRSLAAESRDDGTRLVLMRSDDAGLTGFCGEAGDAGSSSASTTLWPDDHPAEPGPDEVVPAGVRDDDWYVAWGAAGQDVRSIRLSVDDGPATDVRTIGNGEWAVMLPGDEVPPDARLTLLWTATDGSERSTPLEGAWPADPATVTSPAEARRDACAPGRDATGVRPVLEQRVGDDGITVLARDGKRFVVCRQDAEPPYRAWHTLSGTISDLPARDEATALGGGGSDDARTLVGQAGDDVARVQLRIPDGTLLDALLAGDYWLVWGTGFSEDQWTDARLVWYLEDGSRHESPTFP
ncbi:hypothetical protein [Isoptericola sp. NPDC057653]|uniref:hypothetical protein n=1 Tax=Isoptericola sp. NPDC057653 TaxID=3346195 RepID=UPI0036B82704